MRLYIIRHAIAAPHGAPGVSDEERPLTAEGIKKMAEAAQGLKAMDSVPNIILSSPLPRAKQTADLLREALGKTISLKLVDALAPEKDRAEVYEEIRKHAKAESVMLVGHQPSLGELAGEIAWGSAEDYVSLKKGGGCAIDLDELSPVPRGTLLWLLTPAILRRLGA